MPNWRKTSKLPCLVACFLLGILSVEYFRSTPQPTELPARELRNYELMIDGPVRFRKSGLQVPAQLLDTSSQDKSTVPVPVLLTVYQGNVPLYQGDVVHVRGRAVRLASPRNPSMPDPLGHWRRQGIHWTIRVSTTDSLVRVRQAGLGLSRPVEKWRFALRERLRAAEAARDDAATAPAWGLLRGIVLGDRSGMEAPLTQAYRRAGLSHLIAISGQHIGLVAACIFFVLRWLLKLTPWLALSWPLQKLAWLGAWLAATIYTGLAGCPISAVRAWLFITVFVALYFLDERPTPWSRLALAAGLIVLWDTASLWSVSFQLSFAATAILLVWYEVGAQRGWPRRWLWIPASASISLGLAPLIAYYFQEVPLAAFAANLVAMPYFSFVVLPLALGAVLLMGVPVLSTVTMSLAIGAAQGLNHFSGWISSHDWTWSVSLPGETVWFFYLVLGLLYIMYTQNWRLRTMLMAILFVGIAIVVFGMRTDPTGQLRWTVIDVGQGESHLLNLPDGSHYLIDGGGFYIPRDKRRYPARDVGEKVIVPFLKRQGITRLDGIILTHPDPDHYGGLLAVVRSLPVGRFIWNGDAFNDTSYAELMELLEQRRVRLIQVDATRPPWQQGDVQMQWLNPLPTQEGSNNDRSLVMRLDFGQICFLFAGDIPRRVEQRLVAHQTKPCTMMTVPHHGSRTSSSQTFLQKLAPDYAVVSVGAANPFGHPAKEVTARYEALGIEVWQTDRDGAVTVISDGKNLEVRTSVKRKS